MMRFLTKLNLGFRVIPSEMHTTLDSMSQDRKDVLWVDTESVGKIKMQVLCLLDRQTLGKTFKKNAFRKSSYYFNILLKQI